MFSGGLDSILAARILKDEGLRVIGLHFYTGFNDTPDRELERGPSKPWAPKDSVQEAAERLGIELLPMNVAGDEYREIMLNPKYGYGSAGNPCIDCRIYLLIKAKEIMEREGAILVSTGEVLGQRPMSQYKNALRQVEKRSGLTGRLLRPLSAKFLDPTIPENEGIIDRSRMLDIQGRSRKRQQELAREYGIDYYPSPGGGCLLTTVQYGEKFGDLLEHMDKERITPCHLSSLKTGRHLRLESGVKVVLGRNKRENDYLEELLADDFWQFRARDFQGPLAFALDEPYEEDFVTISAITARYGKGSGEQSVVIIARKGEIEREIRTVPASPAETARLLISAG